jgi:hypothetical protein
VSSKHRQTQRYVRALRSTLNELEGLLQRHTLYQVQTRSITLREQQKKHHIFSYDDFYGESSAPIPEEEPMGGEHRHPADKQRKKSSRSKFFTQVREKEFSFSDFDEPGVRINLDLDGMERGNSDR